MLHFYRLQLRERDLDRYLFFFLDFSFLTLLLRLLDDSESLLDEDSYELDELDEDEEDEEDDEDEEASRFLIISFTYFSYYQFVLLFYSYYFYYCFTAISGSISFVLFTTGGGGGIGTGKLTLFSFDAPKICPRLSIFFWGSRGLFLLSISYSLSW